MQITLKAGKGTTQTKGELTKTINYFKRFTIWMERQLEMFLSRRLFAIVRFSRDQVSKLLISVPWKWRRHFLHNPEIVSYESFRIRFDWFRSSFNFSLGDPTSHLRHKWRLFTLPAHLANSDIGEVTEGYFYLIKKCRQNLNLIWTEM